MVSQYIGVKVFLNYICTLLNIPPTKVDVYLVISDENGNEDAKEIKTKGTNSNRLIDLEIKDLSEIIIITSI
jgi:hypothetical protein